MTSSPTCGASAASAHSISGRPRYAIRPLSTPPMRRPWPPAMMTPAMRAVPKPSAAADIQVEAVGAVAGARAFPLLDPFRRDVRHGLVAPRFQQQPVAAAAGGDEPAAAVIGEQQAQLAAHLAGLDAGGW